MDDSGLPVDGILETCHCCPYCCQPGLKHPFSGFAPDVPANPDCEHFDDEEQPLLEPVLREPEGQLDWLLERGDWAEVPFKLRFKVSFEDFKRIVKLAGSRWPAGRHSYFGRLWMYFCYNQDDGEGVNYSFFPPLGSHNRAERMVHFCIWLVLIKHSGAIWQLEGTSVSHSRFRKIDTVLRRLAEAQFLDCKRPEYGKFTDQEVHSWQGTKTRANNAIVPEWLLNLSGLDASTFQRAEQLLQGHFQAADIVRTMQFCRHFGDVELQDLVAKVRLKDDTYKG